MEASFPYEETVDQLRAIAEAKADMESRRPMDRLVVGDVGYGKTEVAIRAAFKAIQDGRQVAVLVPTTVLAAQHDTTFSQRFAAFPITVRLLSRFVPAREQASHDRRAWPSGSVDLVIGTHRLLSRDVKFRDLGLVVVDEEQRFGVAAKERLKRLRREVDVLTLSATPIPRTLNLALAGVRDLSVIETPPEDRLPIQTRVAEATAGLVRDAIERELDRGGQVFYVHNRVETIEAQAQQLRGHAARCPDRRRPRPDARGQPRAGDDHLRRRRGRRPRVHHDHRVGPGHPERQHDHHRSGRHARPGPALPAPRPGRPLEPAGVRLPPLSPPRAPLGRGPQAAPGDLQRVRARARASRSRCPTSRSAAPATSSAASSRGHMAAVGFDLYSRLLADAVEEVKARRERREPNLPPTQAVLDLPIDAHLPDDYVADEAQKLELYRRLARARNAERPGRLPPGGRSTASGRCRRRSCGCVEVAELRLAAEAAGIASISREEGQLVVRFGDTEPGHGDAPAGAASAAGRGPSVWACPASGRATSRSPATRSGSGCPRDPRPAGG